jgi:hypothetical protein
MLRYDEELRGSNNGQYGMQIPLTDFYSFNGWTLKWFTVPRQGLHDRWVTGRLAHGPFSLYIEEHRFKSDFGALDYGRETDIGVSWDVLPNATLRLWHAHYEPGVTAEIRKTWLTFTYNWPR